MHTPRIAHSLLPILQLLLLRLETLGHGVHSVLRRHHKDLVVQPVGEVAKAIQLHGTSPKILATSSEASLESNGLNGSRASKSWSFFTRTSNIMGRPLAPSSSSALTVALFISFLSLFSRGGAKRYAPRRTELRHRFGRHTRRRSLSSSPSAAGRSRCTDSLRGSK